MSQSLPQHWKVRRKTRKKRWKEVRKKQNISWKYLRKAVLHHRRFQEETQCCLHKKDEEEYKEQSRYNRSRSHGTVQIRTISQAQYIFIQKISSSDLKSLKLSAFSLDFLFFLISLKVEQDLKRATSFLSYFLC